MRASTNQRYLARIERVVDALVAAPEAAHTVESLAALAHMSEFHFHRVFRALMGETVQATMRRVRLGFAADRLAGGAEPIACIARAVGYDSPQSFARAFRHYARATPGEFRRRHGRATRAARERVAMGVSFDGAVDIIDVPACELLGQPHDGGPASIPGSFRRFWHWQLRRALLPHVRRAIGVVYLDAADPRGFRYYTAAVVDPHDRAVGDAIRLTLPGGRYARYALCGPGSLIEATFRALLNHWLPHSGFTLDERPLLEHYAAPHGHTADSVTELLVPVRPAEPTNS